NAVELVHFVPLTRLSIGKKTEQDSGRINKKWRSLIGGKKGLESLCWIDKLPIKVYTKRRTQKRRRVRGVLRESLRAHNLNRRAHPGEMRTRMMMDSDGYTRRVSSSRQQRESELFGGYLSYAGEKSTQVPFYEIPASSPMSACIMSSLIARGYKKLEVFISQAENNNKAMRLGHSPSSNASSTAGSIKGHRRNLNTVKSPPLRSSSQQAASRVPLQSAIKAIQSHRPVRSTELAFEAGDVFQVKGDHLQSDGSLWLDVMSPVSGLRGIVPFPKFRIISLPNQQSSSFHPHQHPQPPPLNSLQLSPPSFHEPDHKFLHSRSLQRIRRRLSGHSPHTSNQLLQSPPATPDRNQNLYDCHPGMDYYFTSTDQQPPSPRIRRSSTISSHKPSNSEGSNSFSRLRSLSHACQANLSSCKQSKGSPRSPSPRQPSLQSCGKIKAPAHSSVLTPPAQTKSPQLLCGVPDCLFPCQVKYSFTPETEHELDAQVGEPIMINAYSGDLGWFLCKPISRLGGPGLLPVSHVEIHDVNTGAEVLPENVEHFVRAVGLPRLNEWEEATAAYRNQSITLGTFDASDTPPVALPTVTFSDPSKTTFTDTPSSPSETKVKASSELVREWQRRQMKENAPLLLEPPSPSRETTIPDSIMALPATEQNHGTFISGAAESLVEARGQFWFTLRVKIAFPIELKTLKLRRSYEELVEFDRSFQSQLRMNISEATAEELQMSWLMEHVSVNYMADQQFCAYQLEELRSYLELLSRASIEIRQLRVVCGFLGPRQGDVEVGESLQDTATDKINDIIQYVDQMALASSACTYTEDLKYGPPPKSSPITSQPASVNRAITTLSGFESFRLQHHHSDPSLAYSSSTLSSFPSARSAKFQPSLSSPLTKTPPKSYYNSDGQFTKIKICDLRSEDCIAMKVPSGISLNELTAAVRNRFNETPSPSNFLDDEDHFPDQRYISLKYLAPHSLDESCIDFDDCDSPADRESDPVPSHLGRGQFVKVKTDAQLFEWMATKQKLVLYI
ncbi:hypothetical protein VP01_2952g1, partial [Puccinia sorghi]